MPVYQSFAQFDRLLQEGRRRRKEDQLEATRNLEIDIGMHQYEEKKILEAERHEEVREDIIDRREHAQLIDIANIEAKQRADKHQTDVFDLQKKVTDQKIMLGEYTHAKEKIASLDAMQTTNALRISDTFHSVLGTEPLEDNPDWYKDTHDFLTKTRGKGLGFTDREATRLLQAALDSSKGNFQPTLSLIKDIHLAMGVFNSKPTKKDMFTMEQLSLVEKYGKFGFFTINADGTLRISPKWDVLFNQSEIVSINRSGLAKDQYELAKTGDTEIEAELQMLEYEELQAMIKALDSMEESKTLEDMRNAFYEEREAEAAGVTPSVFKTEEAKDDLSSSIDEYNQSVDRQRQAELTLSMLERTESKIGIDTGVKRKELEKIIADEKAVQDIESVNAEQAEYKRDMFSGVQHLRDVMGFPPDSSLEFGYPVEQIENVLNILDAQTLAPRIGRRKTVRELRNVRGESDYIGIQ